MSTAGNVEPAKNMTLYSNEGSNNNNNNSNCNNNTKNYFASATTPYSTMVASSLTKNKEFDEICKKGQAGHKIMVIMRGAPGSGKSTLAKTLLQQINVLDEHNTIADFVHSSDDFFFTRRGYEFNPTLLPDAHEWNKQRVRRKAAAGWSPIIVDNTNIMVWEMQPYVQIAVQHGYILELLEPQTSWCKSASKLAQRNTHQVPKESIERMLNRYERTTVAELLRLLKETKYTVPLPQLRSMPPLPELPAPSKPTLQPENSNAESNGIGLNVNAHTWVPYEQNASNYWAQQQKDQQTGRPIQNIVGAIATAKGENSLLDLLRDEQTGMAEPISSSVDATKKLLQRHSLNCPNEATGFVLLRQMYPNKQLVGLWDLYVKCNGDVDWAVDILLKEDELTGDGSDYAEEAILLESDEFQCDCNNQNPNTSFQLQTTAPAAQSKNQAKPQRQSRTRRNGAGQSAASSSANKELQLEIENRFVLADNQYSEHTRKIRDIRNGILDQPLAPAAVEATPALLASNVDEDDEDSEDNALLEMDLGENFIAQLRSHFQWEGEMLPSEPESLPSKVFVPRSLAKQFYMVWMEAVHNQLEEQRQQTLRDDEQFARLLKHPKYAECSESPSNVNELLDMELAWSIYNSEQQAAKEATQYKPNDIATHLTKMKLCEKFPEIPKDTVLQVFEDTKNNYVQTVEVLDSNVHSDLTGAELYEQALQESKKLKEQEQQTPTKLASPRITVNIKSQSPQLHEEAKSAALRDFEETRNLAAHHSQLRAECNLKAKQAIQQGNGSVALYYSEIAQLHKKKIDVFNHRAANCIMEVHKHTQNNPDLLDLHYLHTMEAVSCLDLFLDRHITVLRNCTRVYKHVFIITGRGLHSANGVSTIKKNVKARLAERRLRWQEVNPGLLRVKVFSASRHSKIF